MPPTADATAGRRQDEQALDDIAQLAHVARPVMSLQRRQRVLADQARRQAGGIGDTAQQVVGELRNVLAPLAERRHAQRDHVEAMEELLAEAPEGPLVPLERQPVGLLFGPTAESYEVEPVTRRIAIAAVQVKGVPQIAVEEALWLAAATLEAA